MSSSAETSSGSGSSSSSSTSESSLSSADLWPPLGPASIVNTIEIGRKDGAIDPSILSGGMVASPYPPVKTLGGATPDENGDIEIVVELEDGLIGDGGVYIVPCAEGTGGFIIWTSGVAGCDSQNLLGQLKYGDYGHALPYELPFDALLEALKCPEQPCGPQPPACEE